jgi:hypothetical protein
MPTALAEGLTKPRAAGAGACAAAETLNPRNTKAAGAKMARAAQNQACTFPPGRAPRPITVY